MKQHITLFGSLVGLILLSALLVTQHAMALTSTHVDAVSVSIVGSTCETSRLLFTYSMTANTDDNCSGPGTDCFLGRLVDANGVVLAQNDTQAVAGWSGTTTTKLFMTGITARPVTFQLFDTQTPGVLDGPMVASLAVDPASLPGLASVCGSLPVISHNSGKGSDGRVNQNYSAPVVVYCISDTTQFYKMVDGEGIYAFSIPLSSLKEKVAVRTLVKQDDSTRVYLMPDGRVLLVSPQKDGKDYFMYWDPNTCSALQEGAEYNIQ